MPKPTCPGCAGTSRLWHFDSPSDYAPDDRFAGMTKDDFVLEARGAALTAGIVRLLGRDVPDEVEAMVKNGLAVAVVAETERCARLVEAYEIDDYDPVGPLKDARAAAIRARGEGE